MRSAQRTLRKVRDSVAEEGEAVTVTMGIKAAGGFLTRPLRVLGREQITLGVRHQAEHAAR